jgi:hypothetical protein
MMIRTFTPDPENVVSAEQTSGMDFEYACHEGNHALENMLRMSAK